MVSASETEQGALDVLAKDGYDEFSYGSAKVALPDLRALESEGEATNACWPHLLSDVYSSLYKAKPTEREESTAPEAHKRLIRQTMESLDYDAMRTTTRLNKAGSAIATLELGEALLGQLPQGEPKRDEQDANDRGWSYLNGCQSEADQGRAVRRMVRKAKRQAEETMETIKALSWGNQSGSGGEIDLGAIADAARRLRSNDKLRQIARIAGRSRRIALSKRKARLKRQPDEVVGVELGNDLHKVLAAELADLNGPMQPLFMLRYVQRQLFQLETEGVESLGQGPIVVCIDESSSMSGEREIWAKATALGLLAIAQHEGREFAIVSFASGSECEAFNFGSSPTMQAVLSALDHFFGGGTNFELPLDTALSLIESADSEDPMARADVIMITDGACELTKPFVAAYKRRAEKEQISTYTIYIGTQKRSLEAISDGVAYISDLTNDGEALDLAFGI